MSLTDRRRALARLVDCRHGPDWRRVWRASLALVAAPRSADRRAAVAQGGLHLRFAAGWPSRRRPRRAPRRRLVRDAEADRRLHRSRGRRLSRAVGDVRAPGLPRQLGRRRQALSLPVPWRRLRSRRPRRLRSAAAPLDRAQRATQSADRPSSRSNCEALAAAIADWLDNRTGFADLRHLALDEPLPAGTGWWFTLGSVLLFGLGVQVVTGIGLALYYAPTPDHAWDSVRYITTSVRGGAFLRGLHHWGASVVVVAAVSPDPRRLLWQLPQAARVNWIVGILLLLVILAFGLTGYLLPWDQRAYWATVVTINISKLTPVVGEFVAALLRGGADIGALTLTRWYALHVLVLPLALVGARRRCTSI